jgi:hypothetical protein
MKKQMCGSKIMLSGTGDRYIGMRGMDWDAMG